MNPNKENWLLAELRKGLQQLLTLGLEGQPSHSVIQGTLAMWHVALTRNKAFSSERDIPRIREAFAILAARQRRWPAPVDFLEALPRPVDPPLPNRIDSYSNRESADKHILALAKKLRINLEVTKS